MPPQLPPPGRPGPGRPQGPYGQQGHYGQQGPYPGGYGAPPPPPRPPTGPFPARPGGPGGPGGSGGPAAPPPRPPVQSVYGPGGPNRMATPPPTRASRLAVVALVLAVLVAPVGLVLGIVARRRITASARPTFDTAFDEPHERLTGRGKATAAVVLGVVLTLLEIALVVGLTVGIPTSWLPSTDVTAAAVQTQIEQATRLPAGSVRCPGALPATVGATITCTGTQNGQPVNLKATVSSVQGRDVRFQVTRG